MIQSIGLDIIEVSRFTLLARRREQKSWTECFSPEELTYCFGKTNPALHLAARFAVKEAMIKAYSTLAIPLTYNAISVENSGGIPKIICPAAYTDTLTPHVSISHTTAHAAAFVVVSKNNEHTTH